MTNAYQMLKKNKLKISFAAILFAFLAAITGNFKFDDDFNDTDLKNTFYLLLDSKGYLTPDQAANPMSTNALSNYENNNIDLLIQIAQGNVEKDNNGNIIPPDSLIKPISKINTLTISEGEELTSPYSYNFDSSYKYSYPPKQRTLTYIPLPSNSYSSSGSTSEYICVGGAMIKKYDEQKPVTKQQCIDEAIKKSKQEQVLLAKKQRDNIDYLNKLLNKKKQQRIDATELKNKLEASLPVFAVNRFGNCMAFKNIHRELYIEKAGAFDSYDECYSSTTSFRNHLWWNENHESFAIPLACIAILLAGLVAITVILSALSKGVSTASAASIDFISKASSAMNQEKKVSIDATVTFRKDEDIQK